MTINFEKDYVIRIEDENKRLKQEIFNTYLLQQQQETLISELKIELLRRLKKQFC